MLCFVAADPKQQKLLEAEWLAKLEEEEIENLEKALAEEKKAREADKKALAEEKKARAEDKKIIAELQRKLAKLEEKPNHPTF